MFATSHSSVAPWRGVSVADTPRPFDREPGTMMVDPSRLPFHLVLLIRLSTGSPSPTGEPGPSGLVGVAFFLDEDQLRALVRR